MQITLFIDEKEKIFSVPFVKGRMFRRVIEIYKKHDLNDIDVETLDILVAFVVDCFNGQFTIDEFYDGTPAEALIETVLGIIEKISGVAKGGNASPNPKKS